MGMPVYCAPRTEHTSYVFVDQLRKMKGSDASWKHDQEPPVNCLDFSDDEEERRVKREAREKKRPSQAVTDKRQRMEGPTQAVSQSNPFYRRQRHYNPRDFGPIQWNSMHANVGPIGVPHGYQPQNVMRPSAFGQRYYTPPSYPQSDGQLPNPFNFPPPTQLGPPVRMAYSNHMFRLPPPPPPPDSQ